METKVFETGDPAYNCGRLLAVFDDLQMDAHEWKLEGAGWSNDIMERHHQRPIAPLEFCGGSTNTT